MYRMNSRPLPITALSLAALSALCLATLLANNAEAAAPRKLSPPNTDSAFATRISTPANPANARAVFRAIKEDSNKYELCSVPIDGSAPPVKRSGTIVDGDGEVLATTDLLLILRYQLGFRGGELITNALGFGATRNSSFPVEQYLRRLLEAPSLE
jgi:hypothetical protein